MGKFLKRMISLFIVIVTCFSFMLVPVSASTNNGASFAEWLYHSSWVPDIEGFVGWWKDHFTSDGDSSAYDSYVSDVTSVLGSSVIGDNCVYLGNWSIDGSSSSAIEGLQFSSGATMHISWVALGDYKNTSATATFVAPVSGSYIFTNFYIVHNPGVDSNGLISQYLFPPNSMISSDALASFTASGANITVKLTVGQTYTFKVGFFPGSYAGSWSWDYAVRVQYPTDYTSSVPVSSETRTGSLCGDFFYEGDNGTMNSAENIYFFDETNNTYNNPQTGASTTISRWTYDYATRTYQLYDADGYLITVAYQDSGVVCQEGDTTYNYFYGSSGSGGGSGSGSGSGSSSSGDDTGDKETIWDKLGHLLGSIADGVNAVIKAAIGKILDSLIELVDMINEKIGSVVESILGWFDNIPTLFGGFTAFLTAVFPFLPQELWDILLLGAALLVVVVIIKAIRNR